MVSWLHGYLAKGYVPGQLCLQMATSDVGLGSYAVALWLCAVMASWLCGYLHVAMSECFCFNSFSLLCGYVTSV